MAKLNQQLDLTAEAAERYIEAHFFGDIGRHFCGMHVGECADSDADISAEVFREGVFIAPPTRGIMYSFIDLRTGKPFPREFITPNKVPRRADIDPWAWWTYENSIENMGMYIDALVRKYEVTGDAACLQRCAEVWLTVRDIYYASQVYGIGSFLRPYGGFEVMGQFAEPLGTDQAGPLFHGLYAYWKYAPAWIRDEIADIMVKTLTWYEQQNFRYFYYKTLTHAWELDVPCGWPHAASYYLPAIAFAAKVTDDPRWRRHLEEKLVLFADPRYDLYRSMRWGSDLTILKELLGERFDQIFTHAVLERGHTIWRELVATYPEPGFVRRCFPESAAAGFQQYRTPFNRETDPMGYALFSWVHQGREMPFHERRFICGLAAIGYPGAFEDALPLMEGRQRVPEDFSMLLHADADALPEEVHLDAYSVGSVLFEWLRDYWMLRGSL